MNREGKRLTLSLNNKFDKIVEADRIAKGIHPNPKITIANLSNRVLSNDEDEVLRYGLKDGVATKPKENDIFAFAEDIFDQINRKGLCKDNLNSVQHLKITLGAFSFNIRDINDKSVYRNSEKLKLIKDLSKDLAILKLDKGNGIVLIRNSGYYQSLESLFSDKSKLYLIDKYATLTQLSSLQRYFLTLFNHGEINEDQFKKLHPQNAIVARAHALPKIHKSYTHLPPFHPIVDTTTLCYHNLGSFLTELLTPLTRNEFVLKDSFDAAAKICNIPRQLFDNGYIFASFDVTSLFTNVPLNITVNIILDRVYNENLVNTNKRKRTLKKVN